MTITVGTCGYQHYDPGSDWSEQYESKLQAYSDAFPAGELNRAFYSLPMLSTAQRWREEAVESFEFTLKAWQGITHSWSSPTWNGHRDDVPAEQTDAVGHLQPTEVVRDAWSETAERAVALDANVVVVQTPPGFGASEENADSMRELLGDIDRHGLELAWEPRGSWLENLDWVGDLCDDLDLIHVVDLFRDDPRSSHDIAYIRVHGRNDDRYDYDYAYSDAELESFAGDLRALETDHDTVYCLFNNFEMYHNAARLMEILEMRESP